MGLVLQKCYDFGKIACESRNNRIVRYSRFGVGRMSLAPPKARTTQAVPDRFSSRFGVWDEAAALGDGVGRYICVGWLDWRGGGGGGRWLVSLDGEYGHHLREYIY